MDPIIIHKLSLTKCIFYSLLLTIIYVGCLYLSKNTRPSLTQNRDDPHVITQRLITVSTVTFLLSFVIVPVILTYFEHLYSTWYYSWLSLHMTLSIENIIIEPIKALLLTSVLFIGPIVNFIVFEHQLDIKSIFHEIKLGISDVYGIRNYFIGPLTEEITFRSCIISFYLAYGSSRNTIIFITPLYFGVAHIHHAYETYLRRSLMTTQVDLKQIIFITLFQFLFTTVFGWYASYLFVNTKSTWAPVFAHIFCNSLGVPDWTLDTPKKTRIYRFLLFAGLTSFIYLLKTTTWSNPI